MLCLVKSSCNYLVRSVFHASSLSCRSLLVIIISLVPHLYYRSVPQIRPPPPFATLALVQSAGGGLSAGCDIFSRNYVPPLDREMSSGSVDADFVLALHSTSDTLNLTV